MRRSPSGFTLIELLIVISIIGVLAAVLLPQVWESNNSTNVTADALQMRSHWTWFELYRQKHQRGLPAEGGHKFVLATWTSEVVPHTEENFDKYFAPGARDNDPYYRTKREEVARGGNPWPDLKNCTSADTHYVGRDKKWLATASDPGEAMMADDNEGGFWTLRDGTVNLLLGDGNVRSLSYQIMRDRYGLGSFDKNNPIQTWGTASPITECQKLDQ